MIPPLNFFQSKTNFDLKSIIFLSFFPAGYETPSFLRSALAFMVSLSNHRPGRENCPRQGRQWRGSIGRLGRYKKMTSPHPSPSGEGGNSTTPPGKGGYH